MNGSQAFGGRVPVAHRPGHPGTPRVQTPLRPVHRLFRGEEGQSLGFRVGANPWLIALPTSDIRGLGAALIETFEARREIIDQALEIDRPVEKPAARSGGIGREGRRGFLRTRQKNIRPSRRRSERPQEKTPAAIEHIADLAEIPVEQAAKTLAAIEAQPRVTRELLLREFVETWLAGQRAAYRTQWRRE